MGRVISRLVAVLSQKEQVARAHCQLPCKFSRCLSSWIGHCTDSRSRDLRSAAAAEGRAWPSLLEASASGGRAPLPARLLDRRAAPEHGAATEAAERLLRSQLKVCSKCASPVRPAPCHACCMKQTPRDSSSSIVVSPLFVSSPRSKRSSPPGVYFLCHLFMVAGAATSEYFSVPPPPRERPPPFPSTDFPLTSPSNACRLPRQHKRVITTAGDHDIMYHNHNKNIPCGL